MFAENIKVFKVVNLKVIIRSQKILLKFVE